MSVYLENLLQFTNDESLDLRGDVLLTQLLEFHRNEFEATVTRGFIAGQNLAELQVNLEINFPP